MTWTQWFILFLSIQILHGLGTWKLYIKAGRKAWEAFVPIYNAVILMKIITRPLWWIILLFLPIVNLIMIPAVWVETAKSFGKTTKVNALIAIISLGFYNFYLNYIDDVTYVNNRRLKATTGFGEWVTSILFAIVAATIVHTYFFQPFVIPSSSLEKSLLVGDFLIVSKIHYGARAPMTTVGAPMVHDTLPVINKKSYLFNDNYKKRKTSWLNKLQLPYLRFPGFQTIKRNDIVVFGQPADTLRDMNDFNPDRNYYKPIDKKTNLVKRCVAIAGDTLEIKEGYVYINGNKNELPDRAKLQFSYQVTLKRALNPNQIFRILKKYDITDMPYRGQKPNTIILPAVTNKAAQELKNHPEVAKIESKTKSKDFNGNTFPRDTNYPWNMDYFGPLYIPKSGATVPITVTNLPLYKRAIQEYEGNSIYAKGNQIIINGDVATNYTFKQDYYWMMGDNRHNSIDARAWGLVPFDHVIGKPVFIWMSIEGINDGLKNWKIRWKRVFTTVGGNGERTSYFLPFLVLVLGYYGYKTWRKKKNNTP